MRSMGYEDISNFNIPNQHHIRKKLAVNNSMDLVLAGENGDNLFASARSRNQFFEGRELFLICIGYKVKPTTRNDG